MAEDTPHHPHSGAPKDLSAKTTVRGLGVPRFEGGSGRPPSLRTQSGGSSYKPWFVIAVFALFAVGAITRLYFVERRTQSPIDLTYMIAAGEATHGTILGSEAAPPLPELGSIRWIAVRTLPTFVRDENGFRFAPGAAATGGFEELPIRRVNGIPIDDDRIGGVIDTDPRERRLWVTLSGATGPVDVAYLRVMIETQWARLLAGLSVGALGVLAYWLRPGMKSSVAFLVACLYVAVLWYARAVPFYSRTAVEDFFYYVGMIYLAVPYAVFMAAFTPLRLVLQRPIYAGLAAALPSTALLVGNLILDPNATQHGFLVPALFNLWAFYMIFIIAITVPAGIWCRIRNVPLTPTDRSRGRIMGIAVLVSFAPLIVLTFTDYVTDGVATPKFLAEAGVVLFPLIVAYAIARHNLLRVSELIREGLTYTLLSLTLLLLYAVVIAGATSMLANVGEGVIQGIAVAGTVLIAIPSHNVLRKSIAQRLEIPPEAYEELLHRLDEIAKDAPSPDGYCREVVRLLERVAKTDRVSILVREPGDLDWKISDSLHGPGLTPIMHSCAPLIHEIESSHSDIFLDDYLDELTTLQRIDTPLESLRALEANAVLPLSARNQVIGALALGDRLDQRNHSARELKLYKRLGAHIASALVQMFDRLQTASGNRIVDIYPECPKRIGNYIIERVLGEGGMSYVYLGENSMGYAAVKVCNRYVQSDRKLLERFHREGSAMRLVKHPHIVPIFDVGWEGPEPYLALEYFGRGSLEDVIEREGAASETAAMRYLLGTVRGLDAALKAGIIHRDIKPTNLFVTADREIKIGDFGLARLTDHSTLTRDGEMFGTPHFMSPEVLRGQPADWTADQYALGITMYFALTKQLPYEGENVESLHYQHVSTPVPDVRAWRLELSDACSELLARMIAKTKERRFGSYEQIERAAESILRSLPNG